MHLFATIMADSLRPFSAFRLCKHSEQLLDSDPTTEWDWRPRVRPFLALHHPHILIDFLPSTFSQFFYKTSLIRSRRCHVTLVGITARRPSSFMRVLSRRVRS